MKEITHEGQTFVLKSDMENAIQTRLQKMSARAADAEDRAKQLQENIDSMSGRMGALDNLQQQIDDYKSKLDQANGRFSRYQAVSQYGLNDPEQMDLIEWTYERAMSKVAKKDQQPLESWLAGLVENPTSAPLSIRPHLQALQPQAQPEQPQNQNTTIKPDPVMERPQPPRLNHGAIAAPPQTDNLIDRGLNDLEFYRENREAIKKAFYNNRRS